MEGPISFWGYKERESNLILSEHDDDDKSISLYSGDAAGKVSILIDESIGRCEKKFIYIGVQIWMKPR